MSSTILYRSGERDMSHLKEYSYRNIRVLKTLYKTEEWEQKDIAEFFDIHPSTVSKAIQEFGLEQYGPGWAGNFVLENNHGYPSFIADSTTVPIHKLVAVSEGADPQKVFSDSSYTIHHKNGCKIDNRPENLELLGIEEHGRIDGRKAGSGYTHSELLAVVEFMLNPKPNTNEDGQ